MPQKEGWCACYDIVEYHNTNLHHLKLAELQSDMPKENATWQMGKKENGAFKRRR